ncbi:MAG TPA: thiol-disulfide oxidoreductase DCC family protein [Flavisolibacter sp.]|nr:thiol-disulfide oxidoreductase DCC family protein [Flavisolibacter sp.]
MMDHPLVLFDGVCNFCNGAVNFLIKQDKKKVFRFAALQSEKGKELLMEYGFSSVFTNSFVLIENGKAYQKSTAALKAARYLSLYWKWTQIFWLVPKFLRDGIYDVIAKNRYRWFGRKEQCMIPTPDIRSRFLQ